MGNENDDQYTSPDNLHLEESHVPEKFINIENESVSEDSGTIEYVPIFEWVFDFRKRLGRISFLFFTALSFLGIIWTNGLVHLLTFINVGYSDVFGHAWFRITSGYYFMTISYIFFIFMIWLWSIKRLNDSSHSRWWILTTFIPLVGNAILFFILLLSASDPKVNRSGKSEKFRSIVEPEPDELPLV